MPLRPVAADAAVIAGSGRVALPAGFGGRPGIWTNEGGWKRSMIYASERIRLNYTLHRILISYTPPRIFKDVMALARTSKQIGAVIQRARKTCNWTQQDLAERAGLRQGTISSIESGDKPAKLSSILSVLAALDLEFRIGPRAKSSHSDIEELF